MADQEHQAMKANQLSATDAIYGVRKSYVDQLWRHYTDWQHTEPGYTPDWDAWEDEYVEGTGVYEWEQWIPTCPSGQQWVPSAGGCV